MQQKIIPADWQAAIDALVASGGTAVLIGAGDTGKTTFCVALITAALQNGLRTAAIDSDVGQSEIGPPTTIGMGWADKPVASLRDIRPRSLYFVGSTSPNGHLLEMVSGARLLAETARREGAGLTVVDTTGLVTGPLACKLKAYKIEAVRPDHLVMIRRDREVGAIERLFRGDTRFTIHLLKAPPQAITKSPELRAMRRAARFFEHFQKAETHTLPLESLAFWGTYLGGGEPVEWAHLRFASESLRIACHYGEVIGDILYLIASGSPHARGLSLVEEHFRVRRVVTAAPERFANLVAGLVDGEGRMAQIGLIKSIDFKKRMISIFTPLRNPDRIRQVRLGTLRVRENGTQIGVLRPGEI